MENKQNSVDDEQRQSTKRHYYTSYEMTTMTVDVYESGFMVWEGEEFVV